MALDETIARVRRRFAAAPAKVFAAFADAELVGRWLSPAPEIGITVLQFDFRVGGAYRFAYDVPGGQMMIVGGVYRSIVPPSKVVFSWIIEPPDEHADVDSTVRVFIAAAPGGAKLTIEHERLDRPGAVERHSAGWAGAFDQLASQEENRS